LPCYRKLFRIALESGNIQSVARFRVISPFLAVCLAVHKERFVTVPVGAIVETPADLQEPGLVTVTLNGDTLLTFIRDIVQHTELLEDRRLSVGV
jgi:hypothetical protein